MPAEPADPRAPIIGRLVWANLVFAAVATVVALIWFVTRDDGTADATPPVTAELDSASSTTTTQPPSTTTTSTTTTPDHVNSGPHQQHDDHVAAL